jgi:ribosomal protein S18 acetylase RimI-like enzyme
MAQLTIRPYEPSDKDAVIALWRERGLIVPQNDPEKDIDRKFKVNPELFLVGFVGDRIVATVMAGYEGHRGAINYLAVASDCRGCGYGRKIMAAAEDLLRARGCAKINLNVRTTNSDVIAFYERIGFTVDEVVCLGKRLVSDE